MSEKTAKADRKKAAEDNIAFAIGITVMKDGGYTLDVPQGASMPLTVDVLMRASLKVYNTFIEALNRKQMASKIVQPVGGIPDGLLRRAP